MYRLKLLYIAIFLPLLLAACAGSSGQQPTQSQGQPAASASPAVQATAASVKVTTNAKLGTILTDAKGMTVYTYAHDAPNVSNCYNQCASNWPPLLATSGTPVAPSGLQGTLATTTRKDGTKQVTYNGAPLYYFAKDAKPGDTNGQGIGGVWYAARPGAAPAAGGSHSSY